MAFNQLWLHVLVLTTLLSLLAFSDVSTESKLLKILDKRADTVSRWDTPLRPVRLHLHRLGFGNVSDSDRRPPTLAASQEPEPVAVAVSPHEAAGFLARRLKRNVWDRSRPDVQQWIMQLMHMGYDEARLETDLSYWMDHSRAHDQGRQHHYDENAPIGPRDSASFRHGANVNYDYY